MILLDLKDLDAMVEELRTLEQQRKELRRKLTLLRDRATERIAKAEEYIKVMEAAVKQMHSGNPGSKELTDCIRRYQQGVQRMRQKRGQIEKVLGEQWEQDWKSAFRMYCEDVVDGIHRWKKDPSQDGPDSLVRLLKKGKRFAEESQADPCTRHQVSRYEMLVSWLELLLQKSDPLDELLQKAHDRMQREDATTAEQSSQLSASGITESVSGFREEVTIILQRQQATHCEQHVRTLKNLRDVADSYAKQARDAGCQGEYNEWAEIADWVGEELLVLERLSPVEEEPASSPPPVRQSLVEVLAGRPVTPEDFRVAVERNRDALRKNPGNTAVRQRLVELEKTARKLQIDAVNLQLESEKKRDGSTFQNSFTDYWAACAVRHCDTANHLQLTADLAADALQSYPEP